MAVLVDEATGKTHAEVDESDNRLQTAVPGWSPNRNRAG